MEQNRSQFSRELTEVEMLALQLIVDQQKVIYETIVSAGTELLPAVERIAEELTALESNEERQQYYDDAIAQARLSALSTLKFMAATKTEFEDVAPMDDEGLDLDNGNNAEILIDPDNLTAEEEQEWEEIEAEAKAKVKTDTDLSESEQEGASEVSNNETEDSNDDGETE